MSLAKELENRGFFHQSTATNYSDLLDGTPRIIYHGIDPSADSAHAGNFVVWMLLRHLAAAGHRVIFLVGGGTGLIGDPKPDAERELKPLDDVAANVTKLKAQAEKLIGQGHEIVFVNNADWLTTIPLVNFLRDIGKHFTVNELVKKDAIAKRLSGDTGISYTEFAYPLLQAYDYLTLYRTHGCNLQIGGSDQWGNIVAGVDLIRRVERTTVDALTVPLIIDKATGKKFGKSEGNAVWLDPKKTSPYRFYQFWLQVSDVNVEDYLKLYTFTSLSEIAALMTQHTAAPHERLAQKHLATAVTALVHGSEITSLVIEASRALFDDSVVITPAVAAVIVANAPTYTLSTPKSLMTVLVESGLASSNREAREFITAGAISLDGVTKSVIEETISPSDSIQLLRRGKKQVVAILPS